MESLFECDVEINNRDFLITLIKLSRKKQRRMFYLIGTGLMLLALLVAVLKLLGVAVVAYIGWLFIGLLFVLGIVYMQLLNWQIPRSVDKIIAESAAKGLPKMRKIIIYEDRLEWIDAQSTRVVFWTQLDRISLTERLILLYGGDVVTVLLDKEGFTKGTPEDFQSFVRQKIPQQ